MPVLPCAIHGSEDTLPPNRPVAVPLQTTVFEIGEVLYPADFDDADAFAAACWAQVVERWERLRS